MRCAQRAAVRDGCRRWPSDRGRGLANSQLDCRRSSGVVGRISGREGDRQSLCARIRHASHRWSVCKGSRYSRGGIELGCAQCGAVGDCRRCCPGDGGRGLVHRLGHGARGRRVVSRIRRREGDRKRMRSGGQHGSDCRSIGKGSGHRRAGVKLRRAERCSIGDGCRRGPSDRGRGLVHRQRDGGRRGCVVRGVGGRQGDRECLRTSR